MIENEQIRRRKKQLGFSAMSVHTAYALNHDTLASREKVVLILHQTWKVV